VDGPRRHSPLAVPRFLGPGNSEPSPWPGIFFIDCVFFIAKGRVMLGTILIIVLLLLLLGAWPAWPYSSGWGYYPSGTLGLVLVVVLVLALMGRI
jgi:hypothetical protein